MNVEHGNFHDVQNFTDSLIAEHYGHFGCILAVVVAYFRLDLANPQPPNTAFDKILTYFDAPQDENSDGSLEIIK